MNFGRTAQTEVDELALEVDQTLDSLDYAISRGRQKSYRRYSKAIRSQEEEDEERQKILLEALHSNNNNKKAVEKNKDKEMRKAEAIKVALAKAKQLAARAFKEDIIDQLSTAVEEQPLFHAGTMLDASARVYSFRVDVTHSEACDVRMKLGDPKTLEKAETREKQTREQHDDDVNASPGSSDSEKEDDGPTDGTRKAQNDFNDEVGRKKQIPKERTEREGSNIGEEADDKIAPRLDESCDVEDLSLSVVEFDSDNEEGVVDTEQLIKKLKKKVDSAHAKCLQRRSKVAMVATDTADLDDLEEASQFCSHLYSKATHNFDEGSTSGLLMQNAATGKHGRRLMLHNDVKCPPDPPREKIDADDLLPFYGLIDDIEKAEPPGSATVFGDCDPSTSLLADLTAQGDETQSFPGPDGNATFAVDAYLTTPERCALLSNLKEFLKRNPPCSLKDALFVSRTRLQKELRISSRKFAKVLDSSVRQVEPALCLSLAHAILTPPGNLSSAMRSAESESCIASAVVADELELFEESFDWVVNRMRWDKMKDARRAAALKTLPGEDPEYNYFFARSSDSRFSLEECVDAEEDACFWRSEVVIRDKESRVTEQDYKMLAQVLADFKVVKVGSLFTRKGDAFNRTLAAVPIITPARKRVRPATGMNVELEATATSYGRLNADGMTDTEAILGMDVHEEFSGDLGNAWDDDAFAAEDSALPADQSAIGGDIQTMPVIREEDCSTAPGPELIVGDSVSPTTAVGDLHFLDENAILKTVSSLITDETHWKKAKPNVETASVTQKQAETETKKKERPKAKKEQDQKQLFEWSDEDELPLSALRDRMAKAKRPLALSRSEEDIINATIVRKVQMQLYMPHYFCKLSHVFVGEWGKLRINRASSAPLETPHHEERWVDSVVRDMQTNDEPTASKSFMEFIAMFNNYFNNADDRNVRAGSEPGLNSSSGDFFDEYTAQDGDDENDIESTSRNASLGQKHNRSFFSDADSDVEDAEMFGVKYSIRQRRINAPAVKRAIATVLSTKELDADMLNAQLEVARRLKLKEVDKLGDHDVSIINENDELDLSLTQSRKNGMLDLSAEEEQLQMREEEEMGEDPTCELHKGDVKVSKVTLEGRHTFSSLLLRVPDFVTGRTANDLNPVNAFSVLLHMCNENNLELAQRRDENGMVPPSAMGDFTILPSRKSKRRHQ